ncbi:hypothetical protein GQ42DRAFT_158824 [Ramicandelaber brevisporus]|nr:hypothetical protein GQ42DRAFT_158824 [Ramicandelaber brevisporus]
MIAEPNPVSLLFSLPRGLQKLITEFFARWETVPALTVNKAFHELFAEHIWRRLDKNVPYDVNMPPEAPKTYGHLVRRFASRQNVPVSDDLLSTFPNLTHLWISYDELKNAAVTGQGKPLERLQYLEFSSYDELIDMHDTAVEDDPAFQWINHQADSCTGKLTIEWRMPGVFALQLSPKLMPWLKSQSEKAQLCFKIESDVIDFGDASSAGTKNLLLRHLVDIDIGTGDGKCGVSGLGKLLTSIPVSERKGFRFPVLKRLTLPVCCDSSSEICSQYDFGSLFPAVDELDLNGTVYQCTGGVDKVFKAILATNEYPEPEEYETAVGALLKCFVRLAVCTTVNVDEDVLDNYRNDFPAITFVESSSD